MSDTRETSDTIVQIYEYAVAPEPAAAVPLDWEVIEHDEDGDLLCAEDPNAQEQAPEGAAADVEVDIAEEMRRNFEAGHAQGMDEGRRAEREAVGEAHAAAMAEMSRGIAQLMESFEAERNRYLKAVEREAVRLAMAVAARILRREAQMDPLMLLGAVRVALGQLSDSTEVRLRVPPQDAKLWMEAVALLPGRTVRPQIIPREGMRLGECVMETELGTVDLGVRAQLAEIERGFFDRTPAAAEPAA